MNKLRMYIIIASIAVVIVAGVIFFLINGMITKDPKFIALSLTDINQNDIPDGLAFNLSFSTATYKEGNYWTNDTQRQNAVNQGFTDGYYNQFFFQDQNATDIKVIGSSISVYNQSAREILNEDIQSYIDEFNCTSFNIQNIGGKSFGCHMVLNVSNVEMSYTNIFFYKNNVVVRVFVGQTDIGTPNLNDEAIQYAELVASRIN